MILSVNPLQLSFPIRLFLTWKEVKDRIGMHLPQNVSFWPSNSLHPPHYICDTDIILYNIPSSNVIGLAFVFYDTSPRIREISGMRNTYRVTSCVWFSQNVITHGVTFKPFPSEHFPSILLSCFPSMIFTQLTCVKQELQCVLNTQSLNSKNSAVVHISNIDMYTWMYIMKDLPVIIEAGDAITRLGVVHFDEFIQTSRNVRFVHHQP